MKFLWFFIPKLTSQQHKIVFLSAIGGLLEFYDFTIYGLFSVYFATQFFPGYDRFAALIASYAIFVVGYLARPIGGVIFSHIGDEIGRKIVLILTMVIMGISSLGLGLLPTYAQIGIFAPLTLLIFRLTQGLAIGGELPSMIVYLTESMPQQQSYAMGIVLAGTDAGLLLGMLINLLVTHYLNSWQIQHYGWRIPFILGGLLCFISYQIRKKLQETKAFTINREKQGFPLGHLVTNYPLQVVWGIGIISIMATFVMLSIIFMPSYLINIVKIKTVNVSSALLIATLVTTIAAYLTGIIANYFSPQKVMYYCLILAIPTSLLSYFLITKGQNLVLALCLLTLLQGCFATLAPILLSHIFPTSIRLTGVAVAYNLGHTIFGGLAPIIVTSLISHSHLISLVPIGYIMTAVIIAFFSVKYAVITNQNKMLYNKVG